MYVGGGDEKIFPCSVGYEGVFRAPGAVGGWGGYFFILNTGALFSFWVRTFMGFRSRDERISIMFSPVGPWVVHIAIS